MPDQSYYEIQGTDILGQYPTQSQGTNRALKGGFNGPNEPASPTAHMTWYDTTSGFEKRRNDANDAWYVVGVLGTAYGGTLPLTGGTMAGHIDMASTYRVTNLAAPSAANDAARKAELDLKANIAAPSFTGDAQVNQDPAGNNSLTRRSWTDGRYLKLSGGTMTGALLLPGDGFGSLDNQPTSVKQVREFVSFSTSIGHRHTGSDARKVRGTDIDSGSEGAGARLVASGSGSTSIWSSALTSVTLATPVMLVDADPAPTSYTDVNVSGSVSATAFGVILAVQAFDNVVVRVRKDGDATDSADKDYDLNTSNAAKPGRIITCDLNYSNKFFEYKRVSGSGTRVRIMLIGYMQY